jgi:hypothetical protein
MIRSAFAAVAKKVPLIGYTNHTDCSPHETQMFLQITRQDDLMLVRSTHLDRANCWLLEEHQGMIPITERSSIAQNHYLFVN